MELLEGITKMQETYSEAQKKTDKEEAEAKKIRSKAFTCYLCAKHWLNVVCIVTCFIIYYVADLLKQDTLNQSFFISLCKTITLITNNTHNVDVCARGFIYK